MRLDLTDFEIGELATKGRVIRARWIPTKGIQYPFTDALQNGKHYVRILLMRKIPVIVTESHVFSEERYLKDNYSEKVKEWFESAIVTLENMGDKIV